MNTFVSMTIYFYIFICIALLAFNIVYIIQSKSRQRSEVRRENKWRKKIENECARLAQGAAISSAHGRELEVQLQKVTVLTAYHEAVQKLMQSNPEQMQYYLDTYHRSFLVLALKYRSRPPMERAFYAYLMSVYHPDRKENEQLGEVLLTYFEDSTVFCRENILLALYSMGRMGAIERAFSLMNDRGWYHDRRLLADGLAGFAGDREKLAWYLWNRCAHWNDVFQVAIVQFASGLSDVFSEVFLAALKNTKTPLETRFALVRYFQRRYYPEAHDALLEILENDKNSGGGLAIAAASAVVMYPGNKTRSALLEALHSRNYYVRRNAAASLTALGITEEEVMTVRKSDDRYAIETLEYMLEKNAHDSSSASGTKEKVGA